MRARTIRIPGSICRQAVRLALTTATLTACPAQQPPARPLPVTVDSSARVPSFDEAIERLAGRFAQHPGRVAVLDFPDLTRRQTPLGRLVSQSLTTSLVAARTDGRMRVLERLQVEQVLKELSFATANVSEDAVEHIGRALNADALIFGTAVPAGGSVIINARMVEVAGRAIIEAGRVTARVPSGIGVDGFTEPLYLTSGGIGGEDEGAGSSALDGAASPRSATRRQGAFASSGSTTWIFELQQCATRGGTQVTCDVAVTNDGPPSPLALFFDHGQMFDGYTRIIDDRDISYSPSRVSFSPSGPAYAHASGPAASVATSNDIRQYPSRTPVRLSIEVDGIAATVSRLRIVELVGGTSLDGFHDVIATFRDVPIRRIRP